MTEPTELCRDDLIGLVRTAADTILSDDDLALMITQKFAEVLDNAAAELAGSPSWRIVVVASDDKKTAEQKCIYCTTTIQWDDSPDPHCLPRCGA